MTAASENQIPHGWGGSVNVDDIFGGGGAGGFGSWADILESIRRGEARKYAGTSGLRQFSRAGGRGGNRGPPAAQGQDMNVTLNVTFDEAFRGAQKRVTVRVPGSSGRTLDVKIPPGAVDGGRLRFRGKGRRARRAARRATC